MGTILLKDASLGYGRRAVLENIDLEISPGDFLVIGGPNGGGKSTLLKSVTGLLPLLAGTRNVDGVKFGYVPQQANADTPLPVTALELVELGGSARLPFWRTFWRMERPFYLECLSECRAAEFARRSFSELSGGQRQRVLLARALAVRPNVLILDEPTAGVDHETQVIIAQLLQRLNRDNSVTVVLVTHEPGVFQEIARRFVRVTEGRISPYSESSKITAATFATS